jgi:hypothetical protein
MYWYHEKHGADAYQGHYEWNKNTNKEEFHLVLANGGKRKKTLKFKSWQAAKKAGWKKG